MNYEAAWNNRQQVSETKEVGIKLALNELLVLYAMTDAECLSYESLFKGRKSPFYERLREKISNGIEKIKLDNFPCDAYEEETEGPEQPASPDQEA